MVSRASTDCSYEGTWCSAAGARCIGGYTKEVWYIRAAQPIKGLLKYSCISDVVRMGEGLLHLLLLLQSLMNVHCSRCSMDRFQCLQS